ncbi:class I SAM-dependent methyltransferase [candidate division KSB1 bacterium]|nr:class I SAM-dependent methyltransferase [candidate division KSB1 bacterium]
MATLSHKKKETVEPYSKLASIYDEVMSHVEYIKWARYIERVINKWQPQCRSLLDISCGTGNFLFSLNFKDIECLGLDMSFEMIKIAAEKNKSQTQNINFFQGDMVSIVLKKKFNVVVCLYDSINYLLDLKLWQQLFLRVADVLDKNGIFVFDICTKNNSVKYFNNYSERNGGENYEYLRESSYNQAKGIHTNKFIITFYEAAKDYIEIHQQKIFSINEIKDFINSTNFKLLGYFNGFTFNEGSEDSLRIHFVLQLT